MGGSSFSIQRTKYKRTFTYRGDLREAISKAEKELLAKQNDSKRSYLLWNYERAKKELEAWDRRIDDLRAFISCAQERLKEEEQSGTE